MKERGRTNPIKHSPFKLTILWLSNSVQSIQNFITPKCRICGGMFGVDGFGWA